MLSFPKAFRQDEWMRNREILFASLVLVGLKGEGKSLPLAVSLILPNAPLAASEEKETSERKAMVKDQLEGRGIKDENVLKAMRTVPRHLFVPKKLLKKAYEDTPLPIGYKQTISQPYVVALMSQSAHLSPQDKVLEVGTGSGYQAAILGVLAKEVYTIEIIKPLADLAKKRMKALGYTNVHVKEGDGYSGWVDHAPYDAILMAAATPEIPPPLFEQLKLGGRLIMPLTGKEGQRLISLKKTEEGWVEEFIIPVQFVPLTRHEKKKE